MHCMHKEAKTGKKIPWHQDGTYWPIEPKATCSVWIAITDVDENNGCMKFIPKIVYTMVASLEVTMQTRSALSVCS